jgi:hypothetical protein
MYHGIRVLAAASVYTYSALLTSISSINPFAASFFTLAVFLLWILIPAVRKD